jgi:four helix bundle protein
MVQDFKKLEVWQDAINFDKFLNTELENFPQKEIYAMTSQLRRASLSISNNIAEGCGKESDKELKSYLSNAMGSCKEVESMIISANEKGYITPLTFSKLNEEINRIGKRLNVFTQRIKQKIEMGKMGSETP